jgi:hypothetical protein
MLKNNLAFLTGKKRSTVPQFHKHANDNNNNLIINNIYIRNSCGTFLNLWNLWNGFVIIFIKSFFLWNEKSVPQSLWNAIETFIYLSYCMLSSAEVILWNCGTVEPKMTLKYSNFFFSKNYILHPQFPPHFPITPFSNQSPNPQIPKSSNLHILKLTHYTPFSNFQIPKFSN